MTLEQKRAIALARAKQKQAQSLAKEKKIEVANESLSQSFTPARKFLQGSTFGFGDEIQAGISAVTAKGLDKVQSLLGGQEVFNGQTLGELYKQGRDELRAEDKAFTKANPKKALALEVGGGAVTGGLGAFKTANTLNNASKAGKVGILAGQGAVYGGLSGAGNSEGETAGEILADTGKGAAIGAALNPAVTLGGQKMAKPIARGISNISSQMKGAVSKARELGYKLSPTQANPGSVLNNTLEGFAGKIKTGQKASEHNQGITNDLAKKALNIPKHEELSPDRLSSLRTQASKAYDKLSKFTGSYKTDQEYIKNLREIVQPFRDLGGEFSALSNEAIDKKVRSFARREITPKNAVEAIKRLRASAKKRLKTIENPEAEALGKAELGIANALEGSLERQLKKVGANKLLGEFRDARKLIAKSYTVESALIQGSGNVDAHKLVKALEKGTPLEKELKDIAEISQVFRSSTSSKGGSPDFSPLDAAATAMTTSQGNLLGLGLLTRPIVRKAVLSNPYQSLLVGNNGLNPELVNQTANTLGLLAAQ